MTTIDWLTLFKEMIAVCSENRTKPMNTLCEQNAKLLNFKQVVDIVTTVLQVVKYAVM
jgi:hypothetical protein